MVRSWLSLLANSATVPSRLETQSSSMMERKESTDDGLSGEGGVSGLGRFRVSVTCSTGCELDYSAI